MKYKVILLSILGILHVLIASAYSFPKESFQHFANETTPFQNYVIRSTPENTQLVVRDIHLLNLGNHQVQHSETSQNSEVQSAYKFSTFALFNIQKEITRLNTTYFIGTSTQTLYNFYSMSSQQELVEFREFIQQITFLTKNSELLDKYLRSIKTLQHSTYKMQVIGKLTHLENHSELTMYFRPVKNSAATDNFSIENIQEILEVSAVKHSISTTSEILSVQSQQQLQKISRIYQQLIEPIQMKHPMLFYAPQHFQNASFSPIRSQEIFNVLQPVYEQALQELTRLLENPKLTTYQKSQLSRLFKIFSLHFFQLMNQYSESSQINNSLPVEYQVNNENFSELITNFLHVFNLYAIRITEFQEVYTEFRKKRTQLFSQITEIPSKTVKTSREGYIFSEKNVTQLTVLRNLETPTEILQSNFSSKEQFLEKRYSQREQVSSEIENATHGSELSVLASNLLRKTLFVPEGPSLKQTTIDLLSELFSDKRYL